MMLVYTTCIDANVIIKSNKQKNVNISKSGDEKTQKDLIEVRLAKIWAA